MSKLGASKPFLFVWVIVFGLRGIYLVALVLNTALARSLPQQALSKLGSLVFDERERGQSELLGWGTLFPDVAKTELFAQIRNSNDPEIRARCMGVLRELVVDGYLKEGNGYIGIGFTGEVMKVPSDPKLRSVIRVNQVQPNTPASRAAVMIGDIIVGVDADVWYDNDAYTIFQMKIKAMKPYAKVKLYILRNDKIVEMIVTLMRRPVALDSSFPFNPRDIDIEGPELAAKEGYFRHWLEQKNLQK